MKFYSIELNKEYNTREEMFADLKKNENSIINIKKANILKSHEKGQLSIMGAFMKPEQAVKSLLNMKNDYLYAVINTTNYMDSHSDVHWPGIWKRSLKNQDNKLYYVDNHNLSLKDIIAWKENVRAYTEMIPWGLVGKTYPGVTEALIFEINVKDIVNENALKAYNEKRNVQNSIRMQYVDIRFAVNSEEKEYKLNKEYFDQMYPEIVNKDAVDEQGYFWGVHEAKASIEGSMVLAGSNDATAIIYGNDPPQGIQLLNEPPNEGTRKNFYLNLIN